MTNFLEQKCSQRAVAMSDDEVRRHLAQTSGWHAAEGAIEKTFAFKGWLETVAFVDALAWVCHVEGPSSRPAGFRTTAAPSASRPTRPAASRSTTSSAPPRPMPSSPSSAEREGRVVSGHGRHVVVEADDGRRILCHARGKKARRSSATGSSGSPAATKAWSRRSCHG
jgi:hypothetical protein